MRLLVFLHGTALMHPGAVGRTRQERVAQVRAAQEPTLHDYDAYVPVGNVVAKLRHRQHQGAQIAYLSSHRNPEDVAKDAGAVSEPLALLFRVLGDDADLDPPPPSDHAEHHRLDLVGWEHLAQQQVGGVGARLE